MERYLKETTMLNYSTSEIAALIQNRKWNVLNEYDKIGGIYRFVQNEIALGYNECDTLTAAQVLAEGIGQCNTKATLLMALLRAVGIPCRLHAATVIKDFQRSLMPKIMAKFAPPFIVHTWTEALYDGEWLCLEGVIADKPYIAGLKRMFPRHKGAFADYAVAVKDFDNLQIDWEGKDTAVQQEAVAEDYGIFDAPDDFFPTHPQLYKGWKKFAYEKIGRKIMTKNAAKIRRRTKLI